MAVNVHKEQVVIFALPSPVLSVCLVEVETDLIGVVHVVGSNERCQRDILRGSDVTLLLNCILMILQIVDCHELF